MTHRHAHLRAVPAPPATSSRTPGQRTHGRRLLDAIEAVGRFPKLAETGERIRLASQALNGRGSCLVEAVESDVSVAAAVLRAANEGRGSRNAVRGIRDAVHTLGPARVAELARDLPTADFFQPAPCFGATADSFRLHAVAVQQMTARLTAELERTDYEELLVAGLLHDIGKLVLSHAFEDYPDTVLRGAETPEQKLKAERLAFGVDHAVVGGLVARRWGLPPAICAAIEHHHDDYPGAAAVVRLADILVHHRHGHHVSPAAMCRTAEQLGLPAVTLRALMYELPVGMRVARRAEPPPLTRRELAVLQKLAEGKPYKQIGLELGRSTSTVRTHLYNTYQKLGVHDRAQAVLLATERGWIQPRLAAA